MSLQMHEPLLIHNTLTRRKETFVPLVADEVRLYVCGVTTYDYVHIGHGRTFVAFDVIQRWLRARGWRVNYVRNITDIDDKIIRRAAENGETVSDLTDRFIAAMHEDFDALGLQRPDHEPRATQFVPQMLDLIGLLEKRELAYQADDGDVNFAVRRYPNYGRLSNRSLDELRAGERVAVDAAKRDPLDFVLWKRAKPGEPQWESRWGPGRPGWHIECSAMASELLGRRFDIHGGGPDLVFPHHENEIAQSEGAYEETFANVWMHTGALRMGEDKMSKSLGNVLNIREAVRRHGGETIRFFLLRTHYRSQMQFDEDQIGEARTALDRLYIALRDTPAAEGAIDWDEEHAKRFSAAMNDDFNTAVAVSVLFDLATKTNTTRSATLARQLFQLGCVLGILESEPNARLQGRHHALKAETGEYVLQGSDAMRIQSLIDKRTAAKKSRDFATADRLRAELAAEGIVLEDSAQGTTWRRQ
jgi:cysteinyl-tRNA synthetase